MQLWNLDSNLVLPSNDDISFYTDLLSEVDAKKAEGFPTQIVRSITGRQSELT